MMDDYPNEPLIAQRSDIDRHRTALAQGLFVASMQEIGRVATTLANAFRALNAAVPPDLDLTVFDDDDQEGDLAE